MKRFRILIECDVELDADDIYPDGIPPDIDAAMVREAIRKTGDARVIYEWNLHNDVAVDVQEVSR